METRGRKSADAAAITPVVHLPGKWPEPPAELTEKQGELWRVIVATKPHDWFGPDTYPLLVEYVRTVGAAQVIAIAIEEFKPEWLADEEGLKRFERLSRLQDAKAATLARLATKMRLSQQSRYSEKAAHTAASRAGGGAKPWQTVRRP